MDLETENEKLRAELGSLREQQSRKRIVRSENNAEHAEDPGATTLQSSATSNVSAQEYNRIKDELAKSIQEYGKIFIAHGILKSRIQYYKDMTRQWRAYVKDWVLMHPNRQTKFLPQDVPQPARSASATDQRPSSPSSAPTPPAFPLGITPSTSDVSRSTSPQQGLAGDRKMGSQQSKPGLELGKDSAMLKNQIIATQVALDNGHDAHLEDLTESDKSEGRPGTANLPSIPRGKAVERGNRPNLLRADSASSPIVVAKRSLKRKRSTKKINETIHVHEDNRKSPYGSKPIPVKDETISSSPLAWAANPQAQEAYDSLDLDDVGDSLITPRKRQRMEQMRLGTSILAPTTGADHEDTMLNDMPQAGHGEDGSLLVKDEGDGQVLQGHGDAFKETFDSNYAKSADDQQRKVGKAKRRICGKAHNDRVVGRRETEQRASYESSSARDYLTPAIDGPVRSRTPHGQYDSDQRNSELATPIVLRPTDPNTHILPRTNEGIAKSKRQCLLSRQDRGAAAVPALAEDGEDLASSGKQTIPSTAKKNSKAPDAHYRLSALLSEPSPAKELPPLSLPKASTELRGTAASRTPLTRTDQQFRFKALTTPLTIPAKSTSSASASNRKGNLEKGRKSARAARWGTGSKPVLRKSPSLGEPPETRPEHEPLRARPIHCLRLEDFKLNPAHSDFAYHESVRKHNERKALSGCTNKNCFRCKDVRKFVENSGYAHLPGQDAKEVDERLIEDFIGGDRHRLSTMSAEEREKILVEARMQQFANNFGKHRQPFDRARSPVGFWDTGFPTTQEGEQNREAVRIREREKVQERYYEAIRPGGKYAFADE